jgi:hypothetical protein
MANDENDQSKQSSPAPKKKDLIRKPSTVPVQVKPTPDNLIMIALQMNRTMQEVQALIDMRNAEIARLAKLEFNEAKSAFLKTVPQIKKNREADFGETRSGKQGASYRFTDLDNLINTIKEAEANAGLSHDWKTAYDGPNIIVTCTLSHVGGHSESDSFKFIADKSGGKNDIQAMKSTISYLRRGTLESVLGLPQGGDDNDGKDAPDKNKYVDNLQKGTPTEEGFRHLVNSFRKGTMTMDQIESQYNLTIEQYETLKGFEPKETQA